MSNVQQPEMRRSKHDPLVTDSVKDKARRTGPPESDKARGKVPDDQTSPYGPEPTGRQAAEQQPSTRSASKRKARPGTPGRS